MALVSPHRQEKLDYAREHIKELPKGTRMCTEFHWKVPIPGGELDFYPSTGKIQYPESYIGKEHQCLPVHAGERPFSIRIGHKPRNRVFAASFDTVVFNVCRFEEEAAWEEYRKGQ